MESILGMAECEGRRTGGNIECVDTQIPFVSLTAFTCLRLTPKTALEAFPRVRKQKFTYPGEIFLTDPSHRYRICSFGTAALVGEIWV